MTQLFVSLQHNLQATFSFVMNILLECFNKNKNLGLTIKNLRVRSEVKYFR